MASQNDVGFIQEAGGSPGPEAKAASSVPGARSACSECEASTYPGREGWELGAQTTRACSGQAADVCSVWTERAEAECVLLEWSLNGLISEAPKGLHEEAP